MKTKDEIEEIAETYADKYADYGNHKHGFINGYTQCQQDTNKQTKELQKQIDGLNSNIDKYINGRDELQSEIIQLKEEIDRLKEDNVKYEFMISQAKFRRR